MLKEAAAVAEGTVRSALPNGAMKPSRIAMEELSSSSLLKANEIKETVNPLCLRGVLPDDGHGAAAGHGDREQRDEGRGEGEYLGV
jgi:hypothetical protein